MQTLLRQDFELLSGEKFCRKRVRRSKRVNLDFHRPADSLFVKRNSHRHTVIFFLRQLIELAWL
jgi:hypothetical protein